MKLYYAPGACPLAVHIALREIRASFGGIAVDLATHTAADGTNFYDISPRDYVPLLLLDDGSRHTEASSLLQYVVDLDPQQTLIGTTGSTRRLVVVEWLDFVSTEWNKTFSPWLWHKETADSTRQAAEDKLATRFAELAALQLKQDYLAGEYSVADAYAFTIVNWANFLALPVTPYPLLMAYLERVSQRPRVRDALRAEGLLK